MAQIEAPPAQAGRRKPIALLAVLGVAAVIVVVSAVVSLNLLRGGGPHTIEYHGRWNVGAGSCGLAPLANLTVQDGSGQIVGAAHGVASQSEGFNWDDRCAYTAGITVPDEEIYTIVLSWRDFQGDHEQEGDLYTIRS
jgi:hypothetical protein